MTNSATLPYNAPLEEYHKLAVALLEELKSGEVSAAWRFKWEHPHFRDQPVTAVRPETLELADAQQVVARESGIDDWPALVKFAAEVSRAGPIERFEAAVETVVSGDFDGLKSLLRADPELIRARSSRRHRATLLFYIAANGVEGGRQKTPANAVAIAQTLLDAGADVNALADMYEAKCSTLDMLVSSCHPAGAGVQGCAQLQGNDG